MFFCQSTETVIGHLGWVDHGAIWTFHVPSQTARLIDVPGAEYLSLKGGGEGLFRVVHHAGERVAISIRKLSEPGLELAAVDWKDGEACFTGDAALWGHVERSAVLNGRQDQRLLVIDPENLVVRETDLKWYRDSYDIGYQGLTDSLCLFDFGIMVLSVQRSSTLVILSLDDLIPEGRIDLSDRGGNPMLHRLDSNKLLASDYDTLCLVNIKARSSLKSVRVQKSSAPQTQHFMGDYSVSGSRCIIARPFSSDAVVLDVNGFELLEHARIVGQPLAVCETGGRNIVSRQWQTGEAEVGRLSPTPRGQPL